MSRVNDLYMDEIERLGEEAAAAGIDPETAWEAFVATAPCDQLGQVTGTQND